MLLHEGNLLARSRPTQKYFAHNTGIMEQWPANPRQQGYILHFDDDKPPPDPSSSERLHITARVMKEHAQNCPWRVPSPASSVTQSPRQTAAVTSPRAASTPPPLPLPQGPPRVELLTPDRHRPRTMICQGSQALLPP